MMLSALLNFCSAGWRPLTPAQVGSISADPNDYAGVICFVDNVIKLA